MERDAFIFWIVAYERAWRTPGAAALNELFDPRATYVPAPFDSPLHGLAEIGAFWEAERESAHEAFTMTSELVAVEGDVGVARVEVRYDDPPATYRDLWVIRLDGAGRCLAFEEWPFFPEQSRSAADRRSAGPS